MKGVFSFFTSLKNSVNLEYTGMLWHIKLLKLKAEKFYQVKIQWNLILAILLICHPSWFTKTLTICNQKDSMCKSYGMPQKFCCKVIALSLLALLWYQRLWSLLQSANYSRLLNFEIFISTIFLWTQKKIITISTFDANNLNLDRFERPGVQFPYVWASVAINLFCLITLDCGFLVVFQNVSLWY